MASLTGPQGTPKRMVDWGHYQVSLTPAAPRSDAVAPAPVRGSHPASVLASPFARLVAALLDGCAPLAVWLGVYFLINTFPVTETAKPYLIGAALGAVLGLAGCQWYLLSRRGQTLGKMAVGVRIVRYGDGSDPGFKHAVVLREMVPRLISAFPILGILFILIDRLCIFGDEHRCLRDVIADTKVVEV